MVEVITLVEFNVSKKEAGQRIDKFIRKYLSEAPLSFIYKLFRKKDIKVNGKPVKIDYYIEEKDNIKIYVSDEQLESFRILKDIDNERIEFEIIYEDSNILIVNKPSGLLIHQDSNKESKTLNNQVLNYLSSKGEYSKEDTFVPSAVHRLDKNTSGIVIVAKNVMSAQILFDLFKNKDDLVKEYITLVKGRVTKNGIIDSKLSKDVNKNYVSVDEKKGKSALTSYMYLTYTTDFSLLKVKLISGHSHQIRVHLKSLNHPIINDYKYGDRRVNNYIRDKYGYGYQLLHASSITFKKVNGGLSYLSNKRFEAKPNDKFLEIVKGELSYEL